MQICDCGPHRELQATKPSTSSSHHRSIGVHLAITFHYLVRLSASPPKTNTRNVFWRLHRGRAALILRFTLTTKNVNEEREKNPTHTARFFLFDLSPLSCPKHFHPRLLRLKIRSRSVCRRSKILSPAEQDTRRFFDFECPKSRLARRFMSSGLVYSLEPLNVRYRTEQVSGISLMLC